MNHLLTPQWLCLKDAVAYLAKATNNPWTIAEVLELGRLGKLPMYAVIRPDSGVSCWPESTLIEKTRKWDLERVITIEENPHFEPFKALDFPLIAPQQIAEIQGYPFDWFEPKTQHLFLDLGAGCMAISAGLTIGEVIARLAKKDLKWEGHELMLIYFFVISFGIYRAPNTLGQSQALLDIETKFSSAPIIELKTPSPDKIWRLVTHIDSDFLAISFPSQDNSHAFKIFGSNEIAEIQSSNAK